MNTLTLQQQFRSDFTSVPNLFFDTYMPKANGEFVKIYLYIMRCLNSNHKELSIDVIADIFNHTEADVMRALRYWNNEGLLEFIYNEDGSTLTGINLIYPKEAQGSLSGGSTGGNQTVTQDKPAVPAVPTETMEVKTNTPPARTSFSAAQIRKMSEEDEIAELFYLAERYLNRLLNPKDREVLLYLYVDLQFTVDLIIHLLEYCVTNNHASIRYIEKVALDWHANDVHTIKDAMDVTSRYNNNIVSVMKAFGISGRSLAQLEKDFIDKWNDDYCFTTEIIVEACNRTIQQTHEPSFKYADRILQDWRDKNVSTLTDVARLDEEFARSKSASSTRTKTTRTRTDASFIQRDYDYNSLEAMLIDNNN